MFTEEDEAKLAHFGIKGMKWGVRKDRKRGDRIRAEAKVLTDAELATRIKRLSAEATYIKLSTGPERNPSLGERLAKEAISNIEKSAKTAVFNKVNPVVEKTVNNVMTYVAKSIKNP